MTTPQTPTTYGTNTIHRILEDIHRRFQGCDAGHVADYIPELSKANPDWYGIAMVTTDGQCYTIGDFDQEFTIQSISKAFGYGLALDLHGEDAVTEKIGVEPSGEAFNEISLEPGTGRPKNPMINAGAIAATGMIPGKGKYSRFRRIQKLLSAYAGRDLKVDEDVYRSESSTGYRNRAIAYLLRNSDITDDPVEETCEVYFKQCSVLVTCRDLAVMGACLANGGVNPISGERVLKAENATSVLSVMGTCGMYDATGEWIYQVGLPAKSGVGGGILGVLPGQLGVAVFSPPLDEKGNSVRGLKTFGELSRRFDLHLFNLPPLTEYTIRTARPLSEVDSNRQRPREQRDILQKYGEEVSLIEIQGDLFFCSMERVLRAIQSDHLKANTIILDLTRVGYADPAAEDLLGEGAADLNAQHKKLYVADPKGRIKNAETISGVEFYEGIDIAQEEAEDLLISKYLSRKITVEGLVPFHEFEAFSSLNGDEFSVVEDLLEMQTYHQDEEIVREGSTPDYFYLLAKGSVAIWVGSDESRKRIKSFSPGVSFGDLAIIDGTKRSADVVSSEDNTTCYLISAVRFLALEDSNPKLFAKIIRNLFRINIGFLKDANREVAALKFS